MTDLTPQAVSDAATGSGNPAKVRASRPVGLALACAAGAGAAAVAFAGWLIDILAFQHWPANADLQHQRVWFLGWMGLACIACIALSNLALFYGRAVVSAGPAHIEVGGGE